MRDFVNDTDYFPASDAAMKHKEIAQVKEGVQLWRRTAGTFQTVLPNSVASPS